MVLDLEDLKYEERLKEMQLMTLKERREGLSLHLCIWLILQFRKKHVKSPGWLQSSNYIAEKCSVQKLEATVQPPVLLFSPCSAQSLLLNNI